MPEAPPGNGGGGKSCFQWGKDSKGDPLLWGKDYPGWAVFRQWLIDHGADVNGWIDAHPAAASCIGAVKDTPPGAPPPPPPPPPADRYCFEWDGAKWGEDHPGWKPFRQHLLDKGADPNTWITAHPSAAKCIGATALSKCFDWGTESWGKDYPGWAAFHKWLVDHGDEPQAWIDAHPQAAACIGAPPPTPAPAPAPPPPPGPGPSGGPPPPTPPAAPPYNANGTPWDGRGVYTTENPLLGLEFVPGCQWVAVMPQSTSADQVAQLKAAGLSVSTWEGQATEAGVEFALANCDGYIGQAEGQPQLDAALAFEATLGGFPKALVTNNFMASFPAGWVAHVEAYENEQANLFFGNAIQGALNRGATVVVPIAGIYAGQLGNPGAEHYLDEAAALGVTSFGAYEAGSMPSADVTRWADPTPGAGAPPASSGGPGGGPDTGTEPTSTTSDGRHYCFKWGGEYWGGDFPGWGAFWAWLTDRGADPDTWIAAHPNAAFCIGAVTAAPGGGGTQSTGWIDTWLHAGGWAVTLDNVQFFGDWQRFESGGSPHWPGDNNPFNMSTGPPGGEGASGSWHSSGAGATDIAVFPSDTAGAKGTAERIKGGRYQNIVAALESGNGEAFMPAKLAADLRVWGSTNFASYIEKKYPGGAGAISGPGGSTSPGGTPGASVPPLPTSKFREPPATVSAWTALKQVFSRKVPSTRSAATAIIDNPSSWLR